jgi:hypothetical protein
MDNRVLRTCSQGWYKQALSYAKMSKDEQGFAKSLALPNQKMPAMPGAPGKQAEMTTGLAECQSCCFSAKVIFDCPKRENWQKKMTRNDIYFLYGLCPIVGKCP